MLLYFYALISNLLFDIIFGIRLIFKMSELRKIIDQNLENIIEELKNMKIMNFIKSRSHYFFTFIINTINILFLIIFILIYTDLISLDNRKAYLLYR